MSLTGDSQIRRIAEKHEKQTHLISGEIRCVCMGYYNDALRLQFPGLKLEMHKDGKCSR